MKLTKSGKRCLLSKLTAIISLVLKNCKLELLIIVLGILCINLPWDLSGIAKILSGYFEESRCSGIAGVASVIIGIYVTVWSIFATSASKINAELLKNRVEGQLFFLIAIGLGEAFITTVLCVFIPQEIPHYPELIALLTTLTSASFLKFVILIMMITKLNIKFIVQEIDIQNAICTETQIKLDEIYQRTVDGKSKF